MQACANCVAQTVKDLQLEASDVDLKKDVFAKKGCLPWMCGTPGCPPCVSHNKP